MYFNMEKRTLTIESIAPTAVPAHTEDQMETHFRNSPINNPQNIPIVITITAFAAILVILRLITRKFILHSFGWDDIVIIPAAALGITYTALAIKITDYGWGHHLIDIPITPHYIRSNFITVFQTQVAFTFAITLVRISILLFYLHIFRAIARKTFTYLTYAVIAYALLWWVGVLIAILNQCRPTSMFWEANFTIRNKHCGQWTKKPDFLYWQGGLNMLGDVLVLVLPMRVVWMLNLRRREKFVLIMLFGLGGLACIAEALRVFYAAKVYRTSDVTWEGYNGFILGCIEVQIGIVCASIPATKALWATIYGKLLGRPNIHGDPSHVEETWITGTTVVPGSIPLDVQSSDTEIRGRQGSVRSVLNDKREEVIIMEKI